ncbi:MAG: signal peptide peptidase SppA [Planctomycetia bacterium]|nr:signal peptide peptidase SppA [Planctomycetia bacterium]
MEEWRNSSAETPSTSAERQNSYVAAPRDPAHDAARRIPSVHPPIPPYTPSSGRGTGCLRFFIFMMVFFFLIVPVIAAVFAVFMETGTMTREMIKEVAGGKHSVAVVQVTGTILSNEGFINDQIKNAFEDESVKAVVLRIDSPGGSAYASDYYYSKIKKLREERNIPVVVSMGNLCASGGYFIAMSVGNENQDVLFAEPSTWTGSIGVIIPRYDLTQLAEKIGMEPDPIRSHRLKGMGEMFRPLTEEERNILQGLVDDGFSRFKEVIYTGRKLYRDAPEKLDVLATGQVFTTKQALENGLIDRVGTQEDAILRALELANLEPEQTNIFKYKQKDTLKSLLYGEARVTPEQQFLKSISDVTTPRAYYLFTQLPGWK